MLYERDGRIARITLNRPDKLDAINDAMPRELRAAVAEANGDDAVHVKARAEAVGFTQAVKERDSGAPIADC